MKKIIAVQSVYFALILFATAVPLFLGGCLGAGTSGEVNISGTWTLSTATGEFTFTQINNTLTGFTPTNQPIQGSISGC